jgi:hypothetical protein
MSLSYIYGPNLSCSAVYIYIYLIISYSLACSLSHLVVLMCIDECFIWITLFILLYIISILSVGYYIYLLTEL